MITRPDPLPGITIREVETPRLKQNVYFSGAESGTPVVFIHGNCASALHWEESMLGLPEGFRGIAPDLRGYGWSEPKAVDATRGLRDWADDIRALVETLGIQHFHLVGHSMGAGIAMQYAIDHPASLLSLTLADSVSPFGFGGTKGVEGTPVWSDFAGSGGGVVNPTFVQLIKAETRGGEDPNSPRQVIDNFYYKPPFKHPREEAILTSLLAIQTGDDFYPGDMTPSGNWPFVAPGTRGITNAFSPKYCNLSALVDITPKPPVLLVQAENDAITSDASMFDIGLLGKLGFIPGYPGEAVFPPQPMVSQTKAVLAQYAAQGGKVSEHVVPDCGHCVYLNQTAEWQMLLNGFLSGA